MWVLCYLCSDFLDVEIILQYIASIPEWQLWLTAVILLLLVIQLSFFLSRYRVVSSFRNSKRKRHNDYMPDISIIVITLNNYDFLETTLPLLLTQEYQGLYEVVIVDIGSDVEYLNMLESIKAQYTNVITTRIDFDPRFPVNNKMALNVGIKASTFANILITTSDTTPVSIKWLGLMAKGFFGSEIVLGYCGIEEKKGAAAKYRRCSRMMFSVRHLSSAIRRKTYRGAIQNIGFTKKKYFDSRGFSHLNMNIGEDDLFIQKIATTDNVSIVLNPNATVRQKAVDGPTWRLLRLFYSYSVEFYPAGVRFFNACEFISRVLFFALSIAGVILLSQHLSVAAAVLLFVRFIIVWLVMQRIARRLGEMRLGAIFILHDICSPFNELALYISRKVRKLQGVWR